MSGRDKLAFVREALDQRKQEHRLRTLKPIQNHFQDASVNVGSAELLNFSSNDYLGLATHPEVIKRSAEYTAKFGAGSTASRLISGTHTIHTQFEEKLAKALGYEACLLFNSGFQANTGIISSIADRNSLIMADKKVHNSLIQGAILSRAEFKRFRHNDLAHLEELLAEAQNGSYNRIWVITETVFSMDGDKADTAKIAALCEEYNALFYSDDAHALGLFGEEGFGLNPGIDGIHISIGTFGKSFGAFGAFVGCSQEMKNYLINFCPGFIYTTALPPGIVGALDAALDLIPTMNDEREQVHRYADLIRKELNQLGFETGDSESQIIPVIIGSEEDALACAAYLEEHGIMATAIRPPTVPVGASRIRLTIGAKHTEADVDQLISIFKDWKHG